MKKENSAQFSLFISLAVFFTHLNYAQTEADTVLNTLLLSTLCHDQLDDPTLYAHARGELEQQINLERSQTGQFSYPAISVNEDTIHWAADKGLAAVIELLIRCGVDANSQDFISLSTPLHHAAKHGKIQAVRTLLTHGADIHKTNMLHRVPLHFAAENGNRSVIQELLNRGADVNARDLRHITPLHFAASKGTLDAIRELATRGADVNARDLRHNTPLHFAASKGTLTAIRELATRGADVNAENYYRSRPLHIAANRGDLIVTQELLDQGADMDASNYLGHTPLHFAASAGHQDLVKFLIEAGALIQKNQSGFTPLTSVINAYINSPSPGKKETIKYLVFFGDPGSGTDKAKLDALFGNEWVAWQPEKRKIKQIISPGLHDIEVLKELATEFAMPSYAERKRVAEEPLPAEGEKRQRIE